MGFVGQVRVEAVQGPQHALKAAGPRPMDVANTTMPSFYPGQVAVPTGVLALVSIAGSSMEWRRFLRASTEKPTQLEQQPPTAPGSLKRHDLLRMVVGFSPPIDFR